ncbi:MAG: hypothetical protein FJY10_05215 [Bacteroidetes bacterium]|nr:hypothetical protein [Bacteroidota bacterium]
MKKSIVLILFVVISAVILFSCKEQQTTAPVSQDTIKELVMNYLKASQAKDTAALLAMMPDSGKILVFGTCAEDCFMEKCCLAGKMKQDTTKADSIAIHDFKHLDIRTDATLATAVYEVPMFIKCHCMADTINLRIAQVFQLNNGKWQLVNMMKTIPMKHNCCSSLKDCKTDQAGCKGDKKPCTAMKECKETKKSCMGKKK